MRSVPPRGSGWVLFVAKAGVPHPLRGGGADPCLEQLESWRSYLFVTERHHWIDFRRSPGGQETREKGHENQQECDRRKREWILRAHSVKQRRHHACQKKCAR